MSERKRWSEQDGREVVERWRKSGLSMSAFARQRGLNTERVRYWRDRIEDEPTEWRERRQEGPTFVPGVVMDVASGAVVSVQLSSGTVVDVRVPSDAAPRWVAELVLALVEAQ